MPVILGFTIDPTVALAIGGILAVIGLVFAFFGRGVWSVLMAIIGSALGAILGYLFGVAIGGPSGLLAIGLAFVGGLIGGFLFGKIVKIALALVMGILAAALVFVAFGTPTSGIGIGDLRTIAAVIAFFVVFAISYYFVDELIAIITSIIGGLLVALGTYIILGQGYGLAAGVVGLVVFVLGAAWQTIKLRRKKRIARAMAAPQAAYPYPPAQAPPQQPASPPPPPRA